MYSFCSVCGGKLKKKGLHLDCTKCDFTNYLNPRPTVTAILLKDNKILLTRRARPPFKGKWDLPGGFLEQKERPEAGIIRELREETGLNIIVEKFLGIYPGTYAFKKESFAVLCIFYLAKIKTGSLGAYDDVSESRWFKKSELPKNIAFDSNKRALKDFLKIWK